jgi:hypothetical protein
MPSTKSTARTAGLLYLLTSIPGVFCLIYVPSHFIVAHDAAATAARILASETLFRFGILCEIASFTGFIFVVCALYRLFAGVNKSQSSLMLILMLVSIPISLVNVLNQLAALRLIHGDTFLSAWSQPQREALAMFFLNLHFDGFMVAQVFWGLWLIPFGLLVIKSGFLPRILGILLIVACFGYLTGTLVGLELLPENRITGFVSHLTVFELLTILWLLIMGAKDQPLPDPS